MGKILILEDEGFLIEDLSKELKNKNHEVIFANNCVNALELWKQSDGNFDCIVLNLSISSLGLNEDELNKYFPIHGILVLDKFCEVEIPRWKEKTLEERKYEIWGMTFIYSGYQYNLMERKNEFKYFDNLKFVRKIGENSISEIVHAVTFFCNRQNKEWPIEPNFLSIIEGEKNQFKVSPKTDGLFFASQLRGVLADASAQFWEEEELNVIGEGKIFALYQVVPKHINFPTKDFKGAWFVEFPKSGDKYIAENSFINDILGERKILRIHPGNLYPNLGCCEIFRKCKNKDSDNNEPRYCSDKCFEMDSRIALLYHENLPKIKRDEKNGYNLTDFYKSLKNTIDDYNDRLIKDFNDGKYKNDLKDITLYTLEIHEGYNYMYKDDNGEEKKKEERRPYVGYRCIYSGLMEYFFPIIHSGKIVAVLIHGQCASKELVPEDMYMNYRGSNKELDQWIKDKEENDNNDNTFEQIKLFNHSNEYKPITDKQFFYITDVIKRLEEWVDNEVLAISQKYMFDKFCEIEKDFFNDIKNQIKTHRSSSINKLENLRKEILNLETRIIVTNKLVSSSLKKILEKFSINGFIRFYVIESPIANQINPNKDVFKIIGDSDFYSTRFNSSSSGYSKIIFNKIKERHEPIEKEKLLDGGENAIFPQKYWEQVEGFDPDLKIKEVFRINFSFSPQIAYLIWERYDNLDMNTQQYDVYRTYLDSLYHTLLEPYIILERIRLEKELENTMRISSHESAQVIPAVIKLINSQESLDFINNVSSIYNGPDVNPIPAKSIIDASRRLMLLGTLFKRLARIFKEEKPKLKYADFHRIIFAPDSLFGEKAYLQKYQSLIVKNHPSLKKISLLTQDEDLSHILFNLTDNAIKYGFQGSCIRINVGTIPSFSTQDTYYDLDTRCKKITITVVSFGEKIENEEREKIFDLYHRSKIANGTEGMGIGLFLAKKLCVLLGYEIKCTSEKITDYNLPLKYHYCMHHQKFAELKFSLSETRKIMTMRDDINLIKEAVNDNDLSAVWEITDLDLEWGPNPKLFQKTYRNTFTITIPIKKGDLKQIN